MKKKLGLLVFLFVAVQGFAQPKFGDFMIGGGLSFGRQRGEVPGNVSDGVSTQTNLKFTPRVGMFFSKRVLAGFGCNVNYLGSSSTLLLKDSMGNPYQQKNQYYELDLGFGLFSSYYYPISDKLFWVNTVDVNWGSLIRGNQISTLFADDRPLQYRDRFVRLNLATGIQYFMRPNVSVAVGYKPFTLTYTYQHIVREGQPVSKKDIVDFEYSSVARGFFISLNFLIISDGSKNEE